MRREFVALVVCPFGSMAIVFFISAEPIREERRGGRAERGEGSERRGERAGERAGGRARGRAGG